MQGLPQTDPLANLNPIHTPPDVSVWPLAWGWWLVIAALLVTVLLLAFFVVRHRQFNRARRSALALLEDISPRQADWPARCNALLKRVAVTYYPTEEVASLFGEKWREFLCYCLPRRHVSRVNKGLELLSSQRFIANPDHAAYSDCIDACRLWLKYARLNKPHGSVATSTGGEHV